MKLRIPLRPLLASFFLCSSQTMAADTVSISGVINGQHRCVQYCLYVPGVYDDMGSAMKCATPYANNCYCATAAAPASSASSWVTACASTSCAGGDFNNDLKIMESIYASYCMGAGYTQPG